MKTERIFPNDGCLTRCGRGARTPRFAACVSNRGLRALRQHVAP